MAELEVSKHTVKAIKLFRDKEKKGWEKVKDILLEIAIIVFAITFSLWMHNRSEEKHNQENVKQFLLGVKEDMQNDLTEMAGDTSAIRARIENIDQVQKLINGSSTYTEDSAVTYMARIFSGTTLLIPNNGRYEGFKSSGQIGFIENKRLANLIVDHYQEKVTGLLWVSQTQNDFIKTQFKPYIISHFNFDNNFRFNNIQSQLKESQLKILLKLYKSNGEETIRRYRDVIKSSLDIIAAIDKEDL